VAGLSRHLDEGLFSEIGDGLAEAILEEAGRFAAEEIAPLREAGDKHGAILSDGEVTMPPGWRDLYRRWIEGGWSALSGPESYGGQNLPQMMAVAALEMWNSGAMAFGIGPTLTMGAAEALEKHGSDTLKATYLEKIVSGEWMGTMNLTEPQAGSDLNALKSKAVPADDGTYRIFGQKIFITYGEHDLTDNIIHLVLARLPDAPPGTRGISLFLVPKFLPSASGTAGERNDVFCHSVEHKLGIHASPTCTMIFGDGKFGDEPGAIGYLIGEENRGLACMFTMMNNARLAVGMQGVAVAEAAYQQALAYAQERRQGRAHDHDGDGMASIILHADVQRNLLTMKALTQAARAIAYCCAHALDMVNADADNASHWQQRADLLTPLAKAFSTDIGVEVASIGVQVHGGMGYIEETGAAALLRDARIAPIYEGTNGIQAIDLVSRKLPMEGGEHVAGFIAELRQDIEAVRASNLPGFGQTADRLETAVQALENATEFLNTATSEGRTQEALAGATPYLRLMSLAAGGCMLARGAVSSADGEHAALCRFFAENLAGETAGLELTTTTGAAGLAAAAASLTA
ncbi:MAG: acyl-CoA dehydrogenase, partial [Hyphomicrobiales bacterium]|nr:acyl-CoA dehydrogenase [Hyphomicrobiales bacterium]